MVGLPEAFWAIITAIVVMQTDFSHTLSSGRDRTVATLIGAAVGVALIALRQLGLPTWPLLAVGLVPLAWLTAVAPNLRLACTTLVIVLLVPADGAPYLRALFRVADILFGVLACVVASVVVFPDPALRKSVAALVKKSAP